MYSLPRGSFHKSCLRARSTTAEVVNGLTNCTVCVDFFKESKLFSSGVFITIHSPLFATLLVSIYLRWHLL